MSTAENATSGECCRLDRARSPYSDLALGETMTAVHQYNAHGAYRKGRLLVALVGAVACPGASFGSAAAMPRHAGVSVIVRPAAGTGSRTERRVAKLGGTVGLQLPIINSF